MADKLIKTLNFGTGDTYHLAPEWDNIQNKPEDIGGGGKADSVDWEDVKNKPFGYGDETVLVDNQTWTLTDGAYVSTEPILTAGSIYKVILNGTVYECVAEEISMYGMTLVGAGDTGAFLGNPPTGDYPFAMMYLMGEFTFGVFENLTECTVTLTERKFTKIPKEYYAQNGPTIFYTTELLGGYLYSDAACEKKLTCDELLETMRKSAVIIVASDVYIYSPVHAGMRFKDGTASGYVETHYGSMTITFYTAEYTEE